MGFFISRNQKKMIKLLEKPNLLLEQAFTNLCMQQGQQILFVYEDELNDVEKLKKKLKDFNDLPTEQFKQMYELN